MSDDTKKQPAKIPPAKIQGKELDRPNEGENKVAIDELGTKNIRGKENLDKD
jgi:hypothetical protein